MRDQRRPRQRTARCVLSLRDRYQLYEREKKNPDPSMTREAWVKYVAKKLGI
jgi:hypothetical protein